MRELMRMTSNAIVRIKYNYMVGSEPQALFLPWGQRQFFQWFDYYCHQNLLVAKEGRAFLKYAYYAFPSVSEPCIKCPKCPSNFKLVLPSWKKKWVCGGDYWFSSPLQCVQVSIKGRVECPLGTGFLPKEPIKALITVDVHRNSHMFCPVLYK